MDLKKKLVELLQDDNCPLLYVLGSSVETLADYLIANGVTIQQWIPVEQEMPKEHKSMIPNCGTVSDPVLVSFVCTTSSEPYPKNCVVCETMSRNGVFNHKSYAGEYKAIAWMPKPKPPKGN